MKLTNTLKGIHSLPEGNINQLQVKVLYSKASVIILLNPYCCPFTMHMEFIMSLQVVLIVLHSHTLRYISPADWNL